MNKAREYSSPLIEELINETTPEELEKINKEMEVMSNTQQTGVDILFNRFLELYLFTEGIPDELHEVYKEAKEIEKIKMIEFTDDFWFYCVNRDGSIKITPEKYYEQTYGDNK